MVYIAITLLLGFAAVNTGNNLLYLLVSALLGFMVISGILGKRNIEGLAINMAFAEEIYDRRPTLVTMRVENTKRFLPSFLLRISFLGQSATFFVIDRQKTSSKSLTLRLEGRGRHRVAEAQVTSIFPINFFVRRRPIPVEQQIVVFPEPRPCPSVSTDSGRKKGETTTTPFKGYEGEISRIADYRGGEPLKQIHWKLSARHGELKVKELSDSSFEPVILDLHSLPGTNLEKRLCCGSFLVNRYWRQKRPVGLKLGERIIPPAATRAHKLKLLTELATYGQD